MSRETSYNGSIYCIKAIIKITLVALLIGAITSCKEDELECECWLEMSSFENPTGSYFITGVPTDCDGNYDLGDYQIPEGHYPLGLTNCK